ncbi:MAG: hypothetical protein E7645_04525 [Ruminococcaceae bacterium]|nr:hypothetical protein [Oscillospiraceae bacterium]
MNSHKQYTPTPEEKNEGEIYYEQSPLMKWLDNYWYHYKWPTIITAFFALVLIIVVVQIIDRPKYDINLVCGGTYRMNASEHVAYEEAIEKFIPKDYDGNGEKSANIIVYEIFSDGEYLEAKSQAEANSEEFAINPKYNADELQSFSQYTMTGEGYVFLISEYLYNQLVSGQRLRSVAELYGEDPLPEGITADGYGIYIKDTHFYRYTPAVQAMPDDMILCILRKSDLKNGAKDLEKYHRYEEFFKSIADYRVME